MNNKYNLQNTYIVNIPRKENNKQVYMQSFCKAYIECGGEKIEPAKWMNYRLLRHLAKIVGKLHLYHHKKDKKYIVCSRGKHIFKSSLPYLFNGEIIPMLWDCWPATWKTLEHHLKSMKVRLCFITNSNVIRELSKRLPNIKFVHIPEAVDISEYKYGGGKKLSERGIDVYEMGRKHNFYHFKLITGNLEQQCNYVHKHNTSYKSNSFIYDTWDSFTKSLCDSKIVISFPNSFTNPKQKGHVETLTMRYWECMLSRCVIVGHCPQELIDLIGYNPVIEADFVNPCQQLNQILQHIDDYQEQVNHNREIALKFAPWKLRMPIVMQEIEELNKPNLHQDKSK